MSAPGDPLEAQADPIPDALTAARAALDQAMRVAEAVLALLRAELRLARSSAIAMLWLAIALLFFGVGAWLAIGAAIATGLYQLTGNMFYGVGGVALVNLLGVAWALWRMRQCWGDLSLPHTRRMLGRTSRTRA